LLGEAIAGRDAARLQRRQQIFGRTSPLPAAGLCRTIARTDVSAQPAQKAPRGPALRLP
jgi:hypothetical protein